MSEQDATSLEDMIREYVANTWRDEGSPYLADLAYHRYFGNGQVFVRGLTAAPLPWSRFMISRPEIEEQALPRLRQVAAALAQQPGPSEGRFPWRRFGGFVLTVLASMRLGLGGGTVAITGQYRKDHRSATEVARLSAHIHRRMSRSARPSRRSPVYPHGVDFITLHHVRFCWIDVGDFHGVAAAERRDATTELDSGRWVRDQAFLDLEARVRRASGGRVNAQDYDIRIYFDMPGTSVWASTGGQCVPVTGWPPPRARAVSGLPTAPVTVPRLLHMYLNP